MWRVHRAERGRRFAIRPRPGGWAVAACAGLAVAMGGCGEATQGSPITATAAKQALASAFDRPLVDNVITGPDSTTSKIAASYTGGSRFEHLVAVVFSRPSASRALTGAGGARRIAGPDPTAVIRVANVVVLYSRTLGTIDRAAAFRRALVGACGGCPDR